MKYKREWLSFMAVFMIFQLVEGNVKACSENGSDSASCGENLSIIERLRNEPFNKKTELILQSHPYVLAAEAGELSMSQRRAFAGEQYAIQQSDAVSFAALAGYNGFHPKSLAKATLPDFEPKDEGLFKFLLQGEIYAAPLLLAHAASVGFSDEASLSSYNTSSKAQAFPSYVARLALTNQRAAAAAAAAINFPAWGDMCRRVRNALTDPQNSYDVVNAQSISDEALAFLTFFSTPIEGLDEMVNQVLEKEGATFDELVEPVRLLQEYEISFWDAVYEATDL